MRQEAWRAYLELALGLTDAPRKQAIKVAKKVVGKKDLTGEQLQGLADGLLRVGAANRDALTRLIREELDRTLSRVGLATAEEVGALSTRIRELEEQLDATGRGGPDDAGVVASPGTAGTDPAVVEPTVAAARSVREDAAEARAAAAKAAPAPTGPDPTTPDAPSDSTATPDPAATPDPGRAADVPGTLSPAPVRKATRKVAPAQGSDGDVPSPLELATKPTVAKKAVVRKRAAAKLAAEGADGPASEAVASSPSARLPRKSTRRGPGTGEPTP